MNAVDVLDTALQRLAQRRLHPISIVAEPEAHDELAALGEWPVTYSPLHLSFRGVPTFRADKPCEASIVGRAPSGATLRVPMSDLAN
jgi:hypothetical protein